MTEANIIGVIPAAGQASRLWRLPMSKELLPVGFIDHVEGEKTRQIPKVVSQYLVDQFVNAGVCQAIMVLTSQKLDLLRYYSSGQNIQLDLAYMLIEESISMPHSIARAHAWFASHTIVFGMPDTIFTPKDAVRKVLEFHKIKSADLTLGLFPTEQPWRFGMVEIEKTGQVTRCIDKPMESQLEWMWGTACWEPTFSDLLMNHLSTLPENSEVEIVLGDIFQIAIDEGLQVYGLPFVDGEYYDIGTSEAYANAIRTRDLF
jgi:glucose-1-phosphate thymidylyltransferase